MRISFVHHEFHETTKSSHFFRDIARTQGEVDTFGLSPDGTVPRTFIDKVLAYDRIIVWQLENVARAISSVAPSKLVFVPMYDGCRLLPDSWWRSFAAARIISFSWALHEKCRRLGLDSYQTQFFPDPSRYKQVEDFSSLHGFLWQRRVDVSLDDVEHLFPGTQWRSFHLQSGMDPGYGPAALPSKAQIERLRLKQTSFVTKQNPRSGSRANVYFAPRLHEGIGMSFLEAMARGQCVIANNESTMNEYIEDRVNGILYSQFNKRPSELTPSTAKQLGAAARRRIEAGYEDWIHDRDVRLPALLRGGEKGLPRIRALASGAKVGGTAKMRKPTSRLTAPKVSVAVVVRNAKDKIDETLRSAIQQDFPSKEIVVVDGLSDDGTLDVIARYRDSINNFVSEKDAGVYDAMNKAAVLSRGTFIIYMNAGDVFSSPSAIRRAMEACPDTADFVIGHHVFREPGVREVFHRAARFEDTWQTLRSGQLSHRWLSGIPCHQATFTRRTLIEEHRYSTEYRIAADHEFMFRMRERGAVFHHCGECLAIYESGGFSAKNQKLCVQEWWRIASGLTDILYQVD